MTVKNWGILPPEPVESHYQPKKSTPKRESLSFGTSLIRSLHWGVFGLAVGLAIIGFHDVFLLFPQEIPPLYVLFMSLVAFVAAIYLHQVGKDT